MSFSDIIQIVISGLIICLFFWLIGKFVVSFFSEYLNKIQQNLLAPLVGLVLCPILLAIIVTKFNTVLFIPLLILILFLFLFVFRKRITISKYSFSLDKKDMMMALSFLIIFLSVLVIQLFRNSIHIPHLAPIGEVDFGIYINISEQLIEFGNEDYSNVFKYFSKSSGSTHSPYHYFDLWLNALFQIFSNINHLYVHIFLLVPILCSIGVYSLSFCLSVFTSTEKRNDWLFYLVISFVVSFIVGYVPFFNIGDNGYEITHSQMISYPKLIYSYLFLAFGSFFVSKKNIIGLTFVAIFCSSFFILFLPISVVLIGLLFLVNLKRYSFSDILTSIGIGISFIILLLIFYYYNNVFESDDIITNSVEEKSISILNRFKSYFIDYIPKLVYFIPLVLITLIVIIKKYKFIFEGFIFFIIYIFAGMISYTVAFENLESRQLVHQSFMPALQFMFSIAVFIFFYRLNISKYLKILFLVLVVFKFSISISYHIKYDGDFYVSSYFKKQIEENRHEFSKIGILVLDDNDVANNWRNIHPFLNFRTSFVKYIDNTFLVQASFIDLNKHDHIPPAFEALYLESPFITFMGDREYSLAVKEFINKYGISYIVWNKVEVFSKLKVHPKKTIFDPHSQYYITFIE